MCWVEICILGFFHIKLRAACSRDLACALSAAGHANDQTEGRGRQLFKGQVNVLVHVRVCTYARPMWQEFFNDMMRKDDGCYRAKRPEYLFTLLLHDSLSHAFAPKEISSMQVQRAGKAERHPWRWCSQCPLDEEGGPLASSFSMRISSQAWCCETRLHATLPS